MYGTNLLTALISAIYCSKIIIIMGICKVPTLRLKAMNKHNMTHIMYIEMEMLSAIKKKKKKKKAQKRRKKKKKEITFPWFSFSSISPFNFTYILLGHGHFSLSLSLSHFSYI